MQDKTKRSNKKPINLKNITKSKGFTAFTAALLAIFLGLVFGFIVMLFANPQNAFAGFSNVLLGGFKRLPDVFYFATPILMTGLAVGFAFKMGLFNIGASGQFTTGMFFALYVGMMWDLPDNIQPFFNEITEQKPDLSQVNFALCAIGDSSYDTFCQGPEKLISAIQDCDAKAFVDKIQIDVQLDPVPEDPALAWLAQWQQEI